MSDENSKQKIKIYEKVLINLQKNRPLTAVSDLPEKSKQHVYEIFDWKIERIKQKISELREQLS
jgi:16S rRNA G527 N7-methylase RsmG